MSSVLWLLCLLALAAPGATASERMRLDQPAEYSGMADASAGVALSTNLFVAASDENNTLRIYRTDKAGPPIKQLNCDGFLDLRGKSIEADLEGAARIGNRIFWIGSHGRNRNAKERSNRCRFFATDIREHDGSEPELVPAGKPYKLLLADFLNDSRLSKFDLDRADDRAPKDAEGLNIEGLSATPDKTLLIGFRNPIPDEKALIVPLLNPNDCVQGQRARLGDPIQLDLDGLGVRDMALYQDTYIIIAGSFHGGGKFKLYRWAGGQSQPTQVKVDHLNRYNPEALIIYPDRGLREFQVLSDDGERLIDGIPAKQIKNPARQKFRSFWVKADE